MFFARLPGRATPHSGSIWRGSKLPQYTSPGTSIAMFVGWLS
jgi:hypothetical protein